MKQGSADDPFADDSLEDSSDERTASTAGAGSDSQTTTEPDTSTIETGSPADDGPGETGHSLPWLYRRENARDGRGKTKQLHLQQSTAQREGTFKSELENRVGQTVQLTDIREAALLVAMDHVDEVADQLREWGYDFE